MNLPEFLLSRSGHLEVIMRSSIKSNNPISNHLYRILRSRRTRYLEPNAPNSQVDFSLVLKKLYDIGINHGEIMIVHSSMKQLARTNLKASSICSKLLDFIGDSGTLAMPAYPIYSKSNGLRKYDTRSARIWTGELPRSLLHHPMCKRSRHPVNTLSAVGPHAPHMFLQNIKDHHPLPCGANSSWKFCYDNNAWCVFLGVDSAHSATMIHVAEDCFLDRLPNHWYQYISYNIFDGQNSEKIIVRERDPKWAKKYAERSFKYALLQSSVLKKLDIDGLSLEVCRSQDLVDFILSKPRLYPYKLVF